ncbi:uncharacterized protein P884DRAFT_201166, partial [Thermothelomyces heterothallicus CBS 202.75]|uniref:uncharacterized protein n=1 Tax=Thermothelomyces heterothallicus CBS 202.75 TaxID=1149848 RepID=UPI0037424C61
ALTLHSKGAKISKIEATTGIKQRGYIPSRPIKDKYIINALKSRRPKVITKPIT